MTDRTGRLSIHRLLQSVLVGLSVLLALVLLTAAQPTTFNALAVPLATLSAFTPLRGVHLGNHYYGEGWHPDVLHRIDGDNGGTWPDVLVVLSRNVYSLDRNRDGDCRITNVEGKDPVLAASDVITGYLQRASAAGVKIIVRIWPSPGNFITSTHHISMANAPANGDRCDEGADGRVGNRSYDDVGDEIIKIHEWNVTHGITETWFEPANEPNIEWYSDSTLIPINVSTAWSEMDDYFSAIYDYVHTAYPTSTLRVLTPPMAQGAYAERKDVSNCTEKILQGGGYGYEKMLNVFMSGAKNDGYDWHNYWKVGYEAWADCDPNISPHGQHVAYQFPLQMVLAMAASGKPRTITEADLASPLQFGDLSDKDSILGLTAANSLNQFFNAGDFAERIAVWGLNITNPTDQEQNWHEAYRCNDVPNFATPALERPWFTLWWTSWPGWPAFCYRTYLSGVMNNYTTDLIKNGSFDEGATYWNTSRNSSCNSPMVTNFLTTTNPAAGLGVCNNNRDSISQTVTIPAGVTSAYLSYGYYLRRPLAAAHPINCDEQSPPLQGDCFYVEIVDEVSGQTYSLTTQNDNEPGEVWNYRQHSLLNIPNITGHPIKVSFRVRNDQTYPATFWLDDISLQIAY